MESLGEYLEEMRKRHPRLSVRRMAIEAGIHDSTLRRLISGEAKGARPETFKAITTRWGTVEDYRRLLELAGHPVPEPVLSQDTLEVAEKFERLSPEKQSIIVKILSIPDIDWPALRQIVAGGKEDEP